MTVGEELQVGQRGNHSPWLESKFVRVGNHISSDPTSLVLFSERSEHTTADLTPLIDVADICVLNMTELLIPRRRRRNRAPHHIDVTNFFRLHM
jgi:hypothetical protein